MQESLRGPMTLLEVNISKSESSVLASLFGEVDLSTVAEVEA